MPEFAFSANDRFGSVVEGTVVSLDMSSAAEQVRGMGYAPLRIQLIEAASVPAASGVSQFNPYGLPLAALPAPVDLSQPFPVEASPPSVPLADNAETPASRLDYLEPWERGGATPESELTKPPMTLSENGMVVPAGRPPMEPTYEASRPSTGTPYGGSSHDATKPFGQRFKEMFIYPIYAGVVIKDLSQFYRQFATLIDAGLPIFQSLSALEANTTNPKLKEIARAGQAQVQAGGKFSEVMAAYPWIFPPMQIELIRAAEKGGMLDQTLRDVANYVDHDIEIRRVIKRETMQPKITLLIAFLIMGRPGFTSGMPAVSQLVIGSMGKREYTVLNYLWDTVGFLALWVIPIFALIVLFRLSLFNIDGVREKYDTFKMAVPVLGNLVRQFAMAKFLRTFAALFRAGFSMPTALEIAGDASGNGVVAAAARRAVPRVERGELLSDTLASYGVFPPMAYNMIRTGETSGNLDTMLDKTADFYEAEASTKSRQAATILGVAIFLIVALIVAKAIIGFWMGYGSGVSGVVE